jgi:uncharacterized protein (TIGR02147 family)
MASIFTYFDIQEFLKADFSERKAKNPGFSIRAMASKLGLNSSTLTRIFSGKRNLSKNLLPIFIKFLGLRTKEADYFTHLAGFSQSKSERERMAEYRELVTLRNGRTKEVSHDRYAFYEKWYFTAIREILRFFPFSGDYGALACMFDPPITAPQAKRAVSLLLRLGFIDKVGTSYVVRGDSITTGETWHGMAVQRFHQDTLAKAVEALETIPREERDFSTMTMCYSAEGYKKARETLMHAREELARIEERDKAANRVYQINLQLFPLSKPYQQGASQ